MSRFLSGPSGLGTSAARLRPPHPVPPSPARTAAPERIPVPALHCPRPLRDDLALGQELNDRLVEWAARAGLYAGRLDTLRATGFGRLIMLCYPDTDDVDVLLAPARCALAVWTMDDHYCDDPRLGAAAPELLGSRLAPAAATAERMGLPPPYAADFEAAVGRDPVLVALRSAVDHLARLATPVQMSRARHAFASLFPALAQEASWRAASRVPAVWEYLINRQTNSFLPCLAVIDAVGGYELPPETGADLRVQRAVASAALATSLVNDLYSLATENDSTILDFNLPTAIAAEDACPLQEAVHRTADLHDELMHRFEAEAATLSRTGPPELRRYLAGITAWCGGNLEWHRNSPRYGPPTTT